MKHLRLMTGTSLALAAMTLAPETGTGSGVGGSLSIDDRIDALEAFAASVKTDFDAITERLTVVENTVKAIEDGLKTAAPESVEGLNATVEEIKSKMNGIYTNVFGAGPDLPFPPVEPSTGE